MPDKVLEIRTPTTPEFDISMKTVMLEIVSNMSEISSREKRSLRIQTVTSFQMCS